MNLATIAAAVATRFSSSAVTAPSGYAPISASTHRLPSAIPGTPCVIVKPPAITWQPTPGGAQRVGVLEFPVELYVAESAPAPEVTDALYAWHDVLEEQLKAKYDLGLSASEGVIDAFITEGRIGTLTYADHDYAGIVFIVTVRLAKAYNAST
jgi:hypothetical protein